MVLRAIRPEPSRDFVDTLSERIASDGRRTRLRSASRLSFAAALTVFMLGTLASFGGLGYAASSTKGAFKKVSALEGPSAARTPASDQYVEKVTICHNGHTISISQSALAAHLRHGDTIGPCRVLGAGASHTPGGGRLGRRASVGYAVHRHLARGDRAGVAHAGDARVALDAAPTRSSRRKSKTHQMSNGAAMSRPVQRPRKVRRAHSRAP